MGFLDRLSHAWNAFRARDSTQEISYTESSHVSYYRPDVHRLRPVNDKSIVSMIKTRIAVDASLYDIRHVRTDENGNYKEEIDSHLNECLKIEANIDQAARDFMRDVILSMFDEGYIAVVPVDTTLNPQTGSYDILSMRTGKILQWYPNKVQVDVYNEKTCQHEQIYIDKKCCAILENPFYSIMNEPNSMVQRLLRKLSMLDSIDEQTSSGKLDLIIQLPYAVKSKIREDQAEKRRQALEDQLTGSKYGIGYIDGTERIVQLNRSVDNNLLKQIEYLTSTIYNQLGFTQAIFDGTADEQAMLNYKTRTLEPVLCAITEEFRRKFLTKTARTQYQTIMFLSNPFKIVPVEKIADIADRFTRNEIMSSNEIRAIVGLKPSNQPGANELRNKNLNRSDNEISTGPYNKVPEEETLNSSTNEKNRKLFE